MAMPNYCSASNIRRSFHRRLGSSLTVNTTNPAGAPLAITVPVGLDYNWNDPENLGAVHTPPPQAYVVLTWLDEMAGRGGASIVQVDVRVRVGAQDDPEGDPFGVIVDAVADKVEEAFRGSDGGGILNGWVPIFDFTVPDNPVQTDACLFVVNPGIPGAWGQPIERRQAPSSDGYRRIVMRYSVNIVLDRLNGHTYMETR